MCADQVDRTRWLGAAAYHVECGRATVDKLDNDRLVVYYVHVCFPHALSIGAGAQRFELVFNGWILDVFQVIPNVKRPALGVVYVVLASRVEAFGLDGAVDEAASARFFGCALWAKLEVVAGA